jgi:LacI family gluconate utilization system Gnt-I transcriptional repressor
VVAVSDLSAFGAMSEALRLGLRVPQDMAFAGFGAFDVSATCHPRLTTTDVDALEIGRLAGHLVIEALAGGLDEGPRVVEMAPRIVSRESSGRRVAIS